MLTLAHPLSNFQYCERDTHPAECPPTYRKKTLIYLSVLSTLPVTPPKQSLIQSRVPHYWPFNISLIYQSLSDHSLLRPKGTLHIGVHLGCQVNQSGPTSQSFSNGSIQWQWERRRENSQMRTRGWQHQQWCMQAWWCGTVCSRPTETCFQSWSISHCPARGLHRWWPSMLKKKRVKCKTLQQKRHWWQYRFWLRRWRRF